MIAIQDVSYSLRDYLGRVEANPARLEEIETRLAAIDKLKRKYGGSVEEILAFLEDVARKIAEVETAGERLEDLHSEREKLAAEYEKSAADLTARRKAAALQLAARVEQELKPLAMERTVFRIQVEPAEWSETGADRVQFLVSPNAGEEPKPMERMASGGELSRIALALKTCLMGSKPDRDAPPRTLVFDEIDAGIGGRAAEGVARRLKGAGGGESGALRDASGADRLLRGSSLPGGEIRARRAHCGGDRGTGCHGEHRRDRPDAERPEAHA